MGLRTIAAGWKFIQMLTIRGWGGIIVDCEWFENIDEKVGVDGKVGFFSLNLTDQDPNPRPYFPVFGLNTEICSINLRIQSEYSKIRTRKNSVFGHFSRSAVLK